MFQGPGAPSYPGHIMVYQPPMHLSMYPQQIAHAHYQHQTPEQPQQQPQVIKEPKEPNPGIMFGSTPVVSVRHSSSDEEGETEIRVSQAEKKVSNRA